MIKALNALQEILKVSIGTDGSPLSAIKKVYRGEPGQFNQSSLPAITLFGSETDFTRRGSRYDQKARSITIRVILNHKDGKGTESDDWEKIQVYEDLLKMIGEEDSDLKTAPLTVCGLIQNNNNLKYSGGYAVTDCKVVNVRYGTTELRGVQTIEAEVTVALETIADR